MRDAGGGGGLRRRRRADDALGAAVAHAAARAAGVRRAAPAGPPTASVRGECRAAARAAVTRPVQGVQGGDESHSRGWRPARPAWQGPCGWCKALNVTMCWTFSAMHQRDNERYRQRERQSETEQEIVRESERQSEAERERGRYATRGDKHIAAAGVHTAASALTPAPPPQPTPQGGVPFAAPVQPPGYGGSPQHQHQHQQQQQQQQQVTERRQGGPEVGPTSAF